VALLSRRRRPPAELRRLLDRNERVLAVAESDESIVAATQLGLWLPAGPTWRRIGWDRVVKASWTNEGLHLIEGRLDEAGLVIDEPVVIVRLTEPQNLPTVVRTRVETSIARTDQVRVPGGTGRIVARRVPGQDGLMWTARMDSGTPDTTAARAVLQNYLTRASDAPSA
jgi:hypothetical protein